MPRLIYSPVPPPKPSGLTAPQVHCPALISCHKKLSSESVQCKAFQLQCSLYFSAQVSIPDHQKIEYFLSLFTGKALRWATTVWEQGGESLSSY